MSRFRNAFGGDRTKLPTDYTSQVFAGLVVLIALRYQFLTDRDSPPESLNHGFQVGDVDLCEIDAYVLLSKDDLQLIVSHFKEQGSNRVRRTIGMLEHCTVVWTERQVILVVSFLEIH